MDYYRNSPRENPPGPESGNLRVMRGGGRDFYEPVYHLGSGGEDVGFGAG